MRFDAHIFFHVLTTDSLHQTVSFHNIIIIVCFFHFMQSMARAIVKCFGRHHENWPPGLFATLKRLTVMDPTTLEGAVDAAEQGFLLQMSEDDGVRVMNFTQQIVGCLLIGLLQRPRSSRFLTSCGNTMLLERTTRSHNFL